MATLAGIGGLSEYEVSGGNCTDVLSVPLRTSETHENTSTKKPLSADG